MRASFTVRSALLLGAIVTVAGLGSQAAPAQTTGASDPKWEWATGVDPKGWTWLGGNPDSLALFVRVPEKRTGARPRLWVRYEYNPSYAVYAEGKAWLSMRMLEELDCAEWRLRTLQSERFVQRNLGGEVDVDQGEPSVWSFAAPQTVDDAILRHGCK